MKPDSGFDIQVTQSSDERPLWRPVKRLTVALAVVVALVGACTHDSTPTVPAGQTTTAAPALKTTQVTPPPPASSSC
jgi:hypothetical protein